jgi:putative DNA primase/helicase
LGPWVLINESWYKTARAAALKLSGVAREAMSSSAELLSDISAVFDATGDERISTADLLRALVGKEESPWATYHMGKPMTARNLAKRLGEYSIKSMNVRFGHEVQKGFHRSQFVDAFIRYWPQAPAEKTLRRYKFRKAEQMQASPSVAEF